MPLAPKLKDRIDIYAETRTKSATNNERVRTYSFSFSVRAETTFVSGTEQMVSQQIVPVKVMKFRVWFRMAGFTERQLMKFRGDFYNIRSIDPDRDRKFMILSGERAPEGSFTIV